MICTLKIDTMMMNIDLEAVGNHVYLVCRRRKQQKPDKKRSKAKQMQMQITVTCTMKTTRKPLESHSDAYNSFEQK
jgi:hypothetical protein